MRERKEGGNHTMKTERKGLTREQLIGTKVYDSKGVFVGKVTHVREDDNSNSKSFLEVLMMNQDDFGEQSRSILVPVGLATFDYNNYIIELNEVEMETLNQVPDFDEGEPIANYEHLLMEIMVPQPGKIARNPEDFFHFEHSDADIFYNKNS